MQIFSMLRLAAFGAAIALLLAAQPALAQRGAACHGGQSFEQFLAGLKQQAAAAGVSQAAIAAASPYLVYDQSIVNRDRGQRVFGQVFTVFAGRMAAAYRVQQGQARIKAHAAAFARAEKEYGVPGEVIAAFWGLESDFGANMGNLPTLRSLVSLAYDCRRAKMFEGETIAALKIVDSGDLAPAEMIGSWAGELGQTQFLPTHYFNYAVDYDGDGHRNLLRSPADVIGSTANYIGTGLKWPRRAMAAGSAGAARPRVGPGRPHHPASSRKMGGVGRDIPRRPRGAERQSAGLVTVADGAKRSGLSGLPELRRLYRVE
jgi:lytic murein transglycosylase